MLPSELVTPIFVVIGIAGFILGILIMTRGASDAGFHDVMDFGGLGCLIIFGGMISIAWSSSMGAAVLFVSEFYTSGFPLVVLLSWIGLFVGVCIWLYSVWKILTGKPRE